MERFKLSNKQQLLEGINKGGLKAAFSVEQVELDDDEGLGVKGEWEFIDIYDKEFDEVLGHFEPGNDGTGELVCYSAENEVILKENGILDLTKQYWPWF